jgi:hypothetical protein
MTQTVQTKVPESVTAGDTVQWQINLSDYLASDGWVLNYKLVKASGGIEIVSAPSGDDHLVSVPAATSAGWVAGTYSYQAYVDGVDSQRFTVDTGTIVIKPNIAAEAAGYDNRTPARKLLDVLDGFLADYGSKAYQQEYEFNGRRQRWTSPGDFLSFRSKVRAEVLREEAKERAARGESTRKKIYVRF